MKILCLCKQGNTRSVALCRMLKARGHESLAAGTSAKFSDETLVMLLEWAEHVYIQVDAYRFLLGRESIAAVVNEKMPILDLSMDVGLDDWRQPDAPGLIEALRAKLELIPI